MRICYLINGLNGGGAAFPMTDVIRIMRSRGHEVDVVALMRQDGRAGKHLENAGIPYRIIGSGPFDYLRSAIRLMRDLRHNTPDLIWTSLTRATVFGQVLGSRLNIPVVSWQHSAFLKPGNRAILRRTHPLTHRWVADSAAVKSFLQRQVGIAASQIEVWPLFAASPSKPQANTQLTSAKFRIGSLGRLHPDKCYEQVLYLAAKLRDQDTQLSRSIEFVIAGEGPERDRLEALTRELDLTNVHFPGFTDRTAEFLAGLNAYIQPSRKEGLCIAAHEAMQAGLPVVASAVGEIANSVVNGETGWLCEVGDLDGLARAIRTLANDRTRAAALGRAGRMRVLERFPAAALDTAGHSIIERLETEFSVDQNATIAHRRSPFVPVESAQRVGQVSRK